MNPPDAFHFLRRIDPAFAEALDAADNSLLRAATADRARRLVTAAGLHADPAVAGALADVRRGVTRDVDDESCLGLLIRRFGVHARVARAARGTHDDSTPEPVRRADLRLAAVTGVRAALSPDPRTGAYAALQNLSPDRKTYLMRTVRAAQG